MHLVPIFGFRLNPDRQRTLAKMRFATHPNAATSAIAYSPSKQQLNMFERLLGLFSRFIVAVRNMGLLGAYKVIIAARWRDGLQSVQIRKVGKFWYRGKTDFNVMSHFYKNGYRIGDTQEIPVRRIIDAGANIGTETRRFRLFNPDAEIVAIEAARENFAILQRNCESKESIHPIHAALWPRSAALTIHSGSTAEAFWVNEASEGDTIECESITVPEIMKRMGWSEIDILKLDIEGAENEIFGDSAKEWLPRVNCLIFECPDSSIPGTTARIFRALPSENYFTRIAGECLIVLKRNLPWTIHFEAYL